MKNTFYITTPIYYPSGRYHIGTAYTTVLADTIKRYQKLKGKEVYMLTGADEHGQKIETKAKEANKTPQEYVDEMAAMAKELWAKMDIQYDDFIRTTDERHEKVVQKIFDKMYDKGDLRSTIMADCLDDENVINRELQYKYNNPMRKMKVR